MWEELYIPLSSLSDPLSNRQMSNYDQLLQFVAGNDKGNKSLSKIDNGTLLTDLTSILNSPSRRYLLDAT